MLWREHIYHHIGGALVAEMQHNNTYAARKIFTVLRRLHPATLSSYTNPVVSFARRHFSTLVPYGLRLYALLFSAKHVGVTRLSTYMLISSLRSQNTE